MGSLEIVMWGIAGLSVVGVGAGIAADYIRGCRLAKQARDLERRSREVCEAGDRAISRINELTDYLKISRINRGLTKY